MDEGATWYGSIFGPGHIVLDGDRARPRNGHSSPLVSAHVCCGHGRPSQLLPSSCTVLGEKWNIQI